MTTNDIVTDCLIIKSTREADGAFCNSIWLDAEMGKYLADPPLDKADERNINFAVGIENQMGWYPFIAISKETGDYVGTCSIVPEIVRNHWDFILKKKVLIRNVKQILYISPISIDWM